MKARRVAVRETANASKERYGADELKALFAGAKKLVVTKGKNVTELALGARGDADDLAAAVLGPTGNLRAPTAKVGTTWLVGFGEDAWTSVLR